METLTSSQCKISFQSSRDSRISIMISTGTQRKFIDTMGCVEARLIEKGSHDRFTRTVAVTLDMFSLQFLSGYSDGCHCTVKPIIQSFPLHRTSTQKFWTSVK